MSQNQSGKNKIRHPGPLVLDRPDTLAIILYHTFFILSCVSLVLRTGTRYVGQPEVCRLLLGASNSSYLRRGKKPLLPKSLKHSDSQSMFSVRCPAKKVSTVVKQVWKMLLTLLNSQRLHVSRVNAHRSPAEKKPAQPCLTFNSPTDRRL